jgi:anaerobic selenocysteine-containing dehydrogenase
MLILGGNPLASNGSLMTVPDVRARFKALKARGGKLVVVDPRRTETAAIADEHLFIDPGTDAAWLLALIHTLFDEGLAKPGALQPILDQIDAVRAAVEPFSPEAMAAHTGIDSATTRRLARELAHADGGVAYGRMGVSTQPHGVVCQWAIQVLNLLTGNVDRIGGAMLTQPALNLIDLKLMGPGPGAAACAARPSSVASCPCRSWPKKCSHPARARSARWSRLPATRCCRLPTGGNSTRRWRGWTSWSRSISTSMRPHATPT